MNQQAPTVSSSSRQQALPASPRKTRVLLWLLALALMLSAAFYQRRTGPTYPRRGEFEIAGRSYSYRLVRSEVSTRDAKVVIPAPGVEVPAVLHYRRYKSGDEFSAVPMTLEQGKLVGKLPAQPPAGKLEYYVEIDDSSKTLRVPSGEDDSVLIRFKGEVPAYVLVPHIIFMFFSVLIGLRACLSALAGHSELGVLSLVTFVGMTIGGIILGPIVQKYAFGAFWTGFPHGYDLTDNKMLIMWLSWLVVLLVLFFGGRERMWLKRAAVIAASLAMIVVYLIPHSMRGSELDYSKLDQGVPASDAIGTSD